MGRKGYLIVFGLGALFLSSCSEPWFWVEPSSQEMKMLQDGGYCRDEWGRELSPVECSNQSNSLVKEQLKKQKDM